jgi:hypothetical protein
MEWVDYKLNIFFKKIFGRVNLIYKNISPVNRHINMSPPCKGYRFVCSWRVFSVRHIVDIAEFATLGGCGSPRHTGE